MTEQFAIDVAQHAFVTALQIGGPLLAASLGVGMVVSVFQAVTQINEQTLSFVPKILVVAGGVFVLCPMVAATRIGYLCGALNSFPQLAPENPLPNNPHHPA